MSEITRRRLLGTGAIAAGGAVLSSVLPPNLARAIAAEPRTGSVKDIEHVVVLMQENRSFDHYFGTLAGVRGFGDPDATTLSTGKSVFYQPAPTTPAAPGDYANPDGYVLPWHLDTRATSAQAIPSTSHAWATQHEAWDEGRMDNWIGAHLAADGPEHGPYTMGYYKRDDIPFHFALAENFTLCDGYHCSLLGPTWPNRMYLMSAFVDPEGKYGGPMTSNTIPASGPYRWTTYPERLQAAGVSWHIYQEEDDYGTNVMEFFEQYQNAKPGSGLYEHALTISQPGKFEADCAAGTLPTVSWIVPTSGQSEHPAYLPASGADFVADKLEAVAANPELWAKTLIIVNYDENDGLFDHVVPPTPPPGTPDEFIQAKSSEPSWPIGGGIRVPCFLVSPWTVGGWVASENFDHTSVLQLLEKVTGVKETNMSQWRRDTFGDLTSALGFSGSERRPAPPLPKTRHRFWEAEYEVENLPEPALPGAVQTMPVQATHRHRSASNGNGNGASARTAGKHALRETASRFTEARTSHRSDYPGGIADEIFPGRMADLVGKSTTPGTTYAWVAMVCAGGVAAIDTTSYAPTVTLPYDTNPYGIATTPDGSQIYVTESGTNIVSAFTKAELESSTYEGSGTSITVGVYPHGIAASPDGARVYVANTGPGFGAGGSATISTIDTASNAVVGGATVGQSPQIVTVSPDSRHVYVSCLDGVYRVHAESGNAERLTGVPTQAHGLAVSPDGRILYVADSTRDRVLVVDAHRGHTLGAVAVGSNPWNVALTPDGLSAYVTNSNDDTVSVIDTATRRVTATIGVSRIPTGIAAYDDEMWVAGNVSSTVSVISTVTNTVTHTVELGISSEPTTLAFA